MSGFFDIFFGSPQSLYASYAILAAIITICITIILTGTDLTMGNRFLFVFLVILMLIPSIFLTLFQITCMVTGGSKNNKWWCWLYAWIVSIFIILYCVFVIIISFTSLFTYSNAIAKVEVQETKEKFSSDASDSYAKYVMMEQFGNPDEKKMNPELKPEDAPPIAVTNAIEKAYGTNTSSVAEKFKTGKDLEDGVDGFLNYGGNNVEEFGNYDKFTPY